MSLRDLRHELRRRLRRDARNRIDEFLAQRDPESGMEMCDVLLSHIAVGYAVEVDIAVQVIHPEGPESQPNVTAAQTEIVSA